MVTEDSEQEHTRIAGEMGEETVRQLGLIYGGLIAVGVLMVQALLTASAIDTSARICVIAFAVALPLLAALVMVNRQETFRRHRSPSKTVPVAQAIGQAAAFVGLAAAFWHIDWIAGVVFLAAAFAGVLVHSAGFWRLEEGEQSEESDRLEDGADGA
jgi:hypothetical protein